MGFKSIIGKLAFWKSTDKNESVNSSSKWTKKPLSSNIQAFTDSFFSDGSKVAYNSSYSNVDISKRLDYKKLRTAARTAMHDSPIAASIINRKVSDVVDTGIVFDLKPDFSILGFKQDQWSEKINTYNNRFRIWANSKDVMLNGQMNFAQEQRFVFRAQQRDGECFIRIHYNFDNNKLSPIELENIDPENIFGGYDENNRQTDRNIRDGIEFDDNGNEIAYYVKVVKNKKLKRVKVLAKDENSGLPLMLHFFSTQYANQIRGITEIASILHTCEQFKTLTHAQIASAIIQSSIALFLKPGQQDAQLPIELSMDGQYEEDPTITGDDRASMLSDETDGGYVPDLQYRSIPGVNLVPGGLGFFGAKAGEELVPFEPKIPVPNFKEFYETLVTHLSASQNQPYEVLSMKFGDNYSASRAAILMAFKSAQIYIQELVTDVLDPIKLAWFTCEIALNRVSMPGFSDRLLKHAWLNCNWYGAPLMEIDQEKAVRAAKESAEIGMSTLSRIAREQNGSNYEQNVAQLTEELNKLPTMPWSKSNDRSSNNDAS